MSKVLKKILIEIPTAEEDRQITTQAKADPEAQPLSAAQLRAMVPLRSVRGRPKSENRKMLLSVRYSPEVVAFFKSTGEGWQSRMDGVLRKYVQEHSDPT
jgi:uncharacterized protein (DUF4415 family)